MVARKVGQCLVRGERPVDAGALDHHVGALIRKFIRTVPFATRRQHTPEQPPNPRRDQRERSGRRMWHSCMSTMRWLRSALKPSRPDRRARSALSARVVGCAARRICGLRSPARQALARRARGDAVTKEPAKAASSIMLELAPPHQGSGGQGGATRCGRLRRPRRRRTRAGAVSATWRPVSVTPSPRDARRTSSRLQLASEAFGDRDRQMREQIVGDHRGPARSAARP